MNAIKGMFLDNKWLWFHILAGGLLVKILLNFTAPVISVTIVACLSVLWEVFEFVKDDVEKIYGSKKEFILDAVGDIIGASVMAIIVIF